MIEFLKYFEKQWVYKSYIWNNIVVHASDLINYYKLYNEVKNDPYKNFKLTNNGVEGYNNRIKNFIGSIKIPFAPWVLKIT